jgi:hypothetical protein
MTPRHARRLVLAVAALAVGAIAQDANGAPVEQTAAELLDAEGTALMQQQRYAEACPKLAESVRLEPGTGVLLRLGLCDQQLGKTASAWSAFHEAAERAQRAGDEALRQLAEKRADEIAPSVPRVRFLVAPGLGAESTTLSCDGTALDASVLGAPIPIDPGVHSVEAASDGRTFSRQAFTLVARDAVVTIAIPPSPLATPGEERGAARSSGLPPQRSAALVVGGVGVAGLLVGSVLGLVALSSWNSAKSECASNFSGCTPAALDRQSSIHAEATLSTVGFVVGGAGLAGATLLWWTTPKPDPILTLRVRSGWLGLDLLGSF